MRTIKYRIWSALRKIFIADGVTIPELADSNESLEFPMLLKEYGNIIQQFTGIQDCNKKDLYEGDILKVKGYFKGEYEEFSIGVVEWSERDCGFRINIYKNGEPYWDIYHMNEIQERGEFFIVGNIFENGDLLK